MCPTPTVHYVSPSNRKINVCFKGPHMIIFQQWKINWVNLTGVHGNSLCIKFETGQSKCFYATSVRYELSNWVLIMSWAMCFFLVTVWLLFRALKNICNISKIKCTYQGNETTGATNIRYRKTLGEPLSENSQATCTYKLTEISTENWLLCFWTCVYLQMT